MEMIFVTLDCLFWNKEKVIILNNDHINAVNEFYVNYCEKVDMKTTNLSDVVHSSSK